MINTRFTPIILFDLPTNNIFTEGGYIKVRGKGDKERLVPIGDSALKYIEIYKTTVRNHINVQKGFEDHVFLNNRGKKLTRVYIFLLLRILAEKAGIKKSISPSRRTRL